MAKRTVGKEAEVVQLAELVLRERLGGKEVERAGAAVVQNGVEDGQVVAERLAAGGRGHDGDMLAVASRVDGFGLMRVEAIRAERMEPFL